jgi:hypothetical protein
MNTTEPKFYDEPTIVNREDIGDRDTFLWEVTAAYRYETATHTSRDLYAAECLALGKVRAKVDRLREQTPITPETDHDFAEVE